MRRREALSALALLAAAPCLAAPPGVAAGSAAGTLRRARPGNLTTLDPHRAISAADMEISADLFAGLTAIDAAGRIVPGLARAWTRSGDELRWTFELRSDLKWSDGRALGAGDVVGSLRRMLDPATAMLLAYRFDALRGAREIRRGRAPADSLGVRAEGEGRVVIELEHPEAELEKLLAIAWIVPVAAIRQLGRDWAKPPNAVVSGAFAPRDWAQTGNLSLRRNPYYHGAERVALERLEWVMGIDDATRLRLFRTGSLDVAQIAEAAPLAIARRELSGQLSSVPFFGGGWVGLNTARPALRDARVRSALAMTVDRGALAQKVRNLGEQPTESLVPEAVADYPQRARPEHADWPMARRVAVARELLAQAGVRPGSRTVLRAIFSANPLTQRTFLALGAMWAPLGFAVDAQGLESRAYNVALGQRDFDLMDYGPFSAVQSVTSFIGRFRSDSFLNYSNYASPDVDRLIDAAEREPTIAGRATRYLEVERRLLRDYPVIPLYSGVTHRLVSPRVRGWQPSSGLALPSEYLSVR